ELTWFDWDQAARQGDLIEFTARLCRLREEHPVFRRRQFFRGTPAPGAARDDLDWYRPDGLAMTPQDWNAPFARAVMIAMSGATGGRPRPDDPFLLMLNAWWEPLGFTLPQPLRGIDWRIEVDTSQPGAAGRAIDASAGVTLDGRALVLLGGTLPSTA